MTLKMTTAQVVETSVTVTNSSFQNYTHPDDHTTRTTSLQQLPANHNKSLLKRRHHFHSGLKTEFTKHINFNVRRLNRDELDSRTSCYLRCSAKWPPGRLMTVNLHESLIGRKLASILHGTLPGGYSTKFYTGRLRPEIQTVTLIYTIFDRKGTPFEYLP